MKEPTPQDFNTYYGNTFILWRNPKDNRGAEAPLELHSIRGIEHNDTVQYLKYNIPNPLTPYEPWNEPNYRSSKLSEYWAGLSHKPAVYGFHNLYDESVFFSTLIPRREAHRAHTSAKILVAFPTDKELLVAHNNDMNFVSKDAQVTQGMIAWAIYNPKYTPLEEAYSGILEGRRLGYPLSKNFAIIAKANVSNPILLYKTKKIGTFLSKDTINMISNFCPFEDVFKREVLAIGIKINRMEGI